MLTEENAKKYFGDETNGQNDPVQQPV